MKGLSMTSNCRLHSFQKIHETSRNEANYDEMEAILYFCMLDFGISNIFDYLCNSKTSYC